MEFKAQKPIYRQIADYILEKILSGEWKGGDRLPSVRDLAAELQVKSNTVVKAFNFLSDKEIIHTQRGIGYFISDGARQKAYDFQKKTFLKNELPGFFIRMDLLNIDFEELEALYKKMHQYENQ